MNLDENSKHSWAPTSAKTTEVPSGKGWLWLAVAIHAFCAQNTADGTRAPLTAMNSNCSLKNYGMYVMECCRLRKSVHVGSNHTTHIYPHLPMATIPTVEAMCLLAPFGGRCKYQYYRAQCACPESQLEVPCCFWDRNRGCEAMKMLESNQRSG